MRLLLQRIGGVQHRCCALHAGHRAFLLDHVDQLVGQHPLPGRAARHEPFADHDVASHMHVTRWPADHCFDP